MARTQFGFFKFSLASSLKLALLAVFVTVVQTPQVLLAQGIPQRWEIKQYQPPINIGAPRRVQGGGTRAPGSSCQMDGKPLKALIPGNRFGVTVSPYPTFFVYVPALSLENSPRVEFVLEDMEGNTIYSSSFKTSGSSGIISLSLPNQGGLSPLEVGKDYKWSFSIICQSDERSQDITVEGWVRRVEVSPMLKTRLAQASRQTQVELYAEAEIWHDALATLVRLRRTNPNDSALTATWTRLLQSAGLDALTQESLVPLSNTAVRPLQP
ncbi:MAG: DUF928 domain-containing protein [Coleofasciculus sp. Co-bin14]|nr:DUF928 domain-containing protein [Coleofasciculus sp. Co-bin14]